MARNTNTLVNHTVSTGDHISIEFRNYFVRGTVCRVTEKAIQMEDSKGNTKIKVWFPKSALLMQDKECDVCSDFTRYFRVTLATWFKGDEWLDKYINATYDAINPYGA
jgi:hypothetical protein